MTGIAVANLSKSFGDKPVLKNINFAINSGEFVAVLGPSGCGKTTLLRCLAGFEKPDSGAIRLGNTIVADANVNLPPEQRDLGIVFQNYALWPHMSVAENVSYSMKVSGIPVAERNMKTTLALETVEMQEMGNYRPADLSGGQRQRVALARCLAANSSVVLLDEPLANLDVHLRSSMEEEFSRFHAKTGATMFYITHDQTEAMSLADRVAVLDKGELMQFATPFQLYNEPANEMVAGFIGEGFVIDCANLRLSDDGVWTVSLANQDIPVRANAEQKASSNARLSLHPEYLTQCAPENAHLNARVLRMSYRGATWRAEGEISSMGTLQKVSFDLPSKTPIQVGDMVPLIITDGWVLPSSLSPLSPR